MKADAKVVDFAILGTPQTKRNGFKVLGHFTLLLRPMRIEGCSLVVAPNGRFVVWTPDPNIKVAQWAKAEIAETARLAYVETQKRVAV
ncbi:hypothetical protein SAMN05421853_11484 [Roseivivax halotolerans]|uniref:Uncharacterized protein n=1 Tax=Roseivivax halotolerans TaxID=93684 RepID=A0A1I6A338_9RHOB|nr:hypothetical protein [Roseivivax halotolerans]SFQ63119.1 hypothetical protein SAMN05421853_11484 [Roseivivax halotolerans]